MAEIKFPGPPEDIRPTVEGATGDIGDLLDLIGQRVKESSVKTVTAFWSATKSRSTSWTATRFDGHAKSDELETLPAVDAWLEYRDALPPQDRTNFPSSAKDWIL